MLHATRVHLYQFPLGIDREAAGNMNQENRKAGKKERIGKFRKHESTTGLSGSGAEGYKIRNGA